MDLKPENIFFREDGELVLIDFNISTKFGGIARHRITRDVLGSPFYLSPEQGQGLPADGRSDLYSAGIILFEMLTGERPFTGDHAAQLIYKHIHEEIPLLPKRIRDLQTVIDHLLAKNPDERFGSAAALAIALRPFIARYAAPRDGDAPAVKSAN
jgi:serine/threonine-protein kinase PpkA